MASAREAPDAAKKAGNRAGRRLVKIPLKEARTLHHDVRASYGASKILIRSAPPGRGIIAGPIRAVFEVMGISDVVAKAHGSKNLTNLVKATVQAIRSAQSPRDVAFRRHHKIREVTVDPVAERS